jgi:Tfp pilus assembly protein PilF
MEAMKRLFEHLIRHHSKALSSPATRWLLVFAALIAGSLAMPCASARMVPGNRERHPSGQTSGTPTNRQLAEKDAQVGRYYFRIGKYDAAISRFQGAIAHDPRWAEPHELLADAYEKKNDPQSAISQYREYLKIAPHAKDARKIEERMEKLAREEKNPGSAGQ